MAYMKSLTVSGQTYQVKDPEAVRFIQGQALTPAQQANARENLGVLSAKEVLDKLCPSFCESGTVVTCEPVEGQLLEVAGNQLVSNPNLIPVDLSVQSNWVDEGGGSFVYETPYIPAGTYTIFAITDYNGIEVDAYNEATGSWDYLAYVMDDAPETFTHTGGVLRLAEGGGAVSSGQVGIVKLEAGTQYTGTNYTKPTITRCGKNLVDPMAFLAASSNTTLDGDVFTTNFASGALFINHKGSRVVFPAGQYTLTYVAVSETVNMSAYVYSTVDGSRIATKALGNHYNTSKFSFTADVPFYLSIGGLTAGSNLGTYSFKLQLEVGSVATAYEPYKKKETFSLGDPIPALSGVNTLWADTGDITVKGYADPVAIFNKLTSAITASSVSE